jgi:hypothetical protein
MYPNGDGCGVFAPVQAASLARSLQHTKKRQGKAARERLNFLPQTLDVIRFSHLRF